MAFFDPPPDETDLDRVLSRVAGAFDKIKSLPGQTAVNEAQQILIRAIKAKNYASVEKLIAAKIDLNAHDANGDTPLHHAARTGDARMITLLIEGGANPKRGQASNEKHLPIDDAMNFGHAEACKALALQGGFLTGKDARMNPLHQSAEKGKTAIAAAFLAAGIDPNARTPSGSTALLIAVFRGEDGMTRLLLGDARVCRAFNDIANKTDTKRRNAFLVACEKAPVDIVSTMADSGAFLNARTADGLGPFEVALGAGKFETAAALLHLPLDLQPKGAPSLLYALCAKPIPREAEKKAALAETLLMRGGDPDALDKTTGLCPLHAAVTAQDGLAAVKTLLQFQANVNVRAKNGQQALHMAAALGDAPLIALLAEGGAQLDSSDTVTNRTPLMIAEDAGHAAAAGLLRALIAQRHNKRGGPAPQ